MAGLEPHQYVCRGRCLLSAVGPVGGNGTEASRGGAAPGGGGNHHYGGAGGGAGGEPGLCRLGLSGPAGKFLRPDLPPFFCPLDWHCLGRGENVPRPQRKAAGIQLTIDNMEFLRDDVDITYEYRFLRLYEKLEFLELFDEWFAG